MKPTICLNVTIHGPGLGTNRSQPGNAVSSTYGVARPSPTTRMPEPASHDGNWASSPRAGPSTGPTHGVASSVMRLPFMNAPP